MTFLDRIKETSTSTGTGTFTLGGAVLGYKVFTNGTYKYCIVNETESEWEVGEGTVASGVLTRTTIEASSNGGAAVSFSAGTKYVFNTVSAAYVNSLVPYTGATASVNLGAYNITATNIIRAGGLATEFLKADGSVDSTTYMNRAVYDTDGNGVVDAAEKMQTIGRNSTGVTLYKGTIVYISGSTGNRPNFVKAQANSEATSAGTFGVVVSDIANNSDGYVATIGTLADLDTRTTATNPFTSVTLADGDTLYLDPNTAGYVTNVKPSAPNHIVYVGKVVRTSPTLGTIVYRIQNGYELAEIHDVAISSVANNDVLVYESSSTLWKNKSIATILGYTPADDSLVVHLAGAENITGVKTFQNALQTTTGNNLLNTGGGNTYVGYTATTGTPEKLNVYGNTKIEFTANRYLYLGVRSGYADIAEISTTNATYLRIIPNGPLWLLPQDASSTIVLGSNLTKQTLAASTLYGTGSTVGYGFSGGANAAQVWKANVDSGGGIIGNFIFHGSDYGAFAHRVTASTTALHTIKTTGQLQLHNYTSTSVFTGTVAGLLGFDSSGNVITSATGVTGSGTAGQVTYWSGTSAVTGSSNLVWDNTNARLGIGTSSPSASLHVVGAGNTSATTALTVQNSSSSNMVRILNDTTLKIGSQNIDLFPTNDGASVSNSGRGLIISTSTGTQTTGAVKIIGSSTLASGIDWSLWLSHSFAPASGTATHSTLLLNETINQTGGANGITRGLYINPTLTAAADWRSIEWSNTTGWGLYGAGSVKNYLAGNLLLNTTTDGGQRLQVIGSMRVGTTAASAMYWDDTNNRLGIGVTSPTSTLHIQGAGNTSATTALMVQNSSSTILFTVRNDEISKFGTTSFDTTTNATGLIVGTSAVSTSRISVASAGNYQDAQFIATAISSGNINSWSFGQRRDTAFGNTIGSFQIVGAYINNSGSGSQVGGGYRVPLICNPNGDVLINGGNANVVNGLIGLKVNAPTAHVDITASTTSAASLRIRSGTAPTSPNDGDIWYDGTNIYIRVGTTTKTFTII